ncbi:MAG: hypothetical protein IKP73_16250 [Bacteroidales bacterium]|nr:hypothetical protein [Bacteroidales bacterium]
MLTLTSILSTPESSYLEGKSAKGGFPDSFWESYSAFANIRFGERAGSGLNGIVYVWKKVYHTEPEIFVKEEYDRTFLKLPTLGKEPDVEAMAEFYSDEEETSDKQATNIDTIDKTSDKRAINIDTVDKTSDKQAVNIDSVDKTSDKRAMILNYIIGKKEVSTADISNYVGISMPRARFYLGEMVRSGLIISNGANKNRTYSFINETSNKCQDK